MMNLNKANRLSPQNNAATSNRPFMSRLIALFSTRQLMSEILPSKPFLASRNTTDPQKADY